METVLLRSAKQDLRNPEIIAEAERRVARALAARSKPKADNSKRIATLTAEIGNLADAIASGILKASPALATKLAAAESELEQLQAAQRPKAVVAGRIAPNVARMFTGLVDQLDEVLKANPDRAKESLRSVFTEGVTLEPDESGKFLWANYDLESMPLLAGAVDRSEIMVAGVGFEPTTFGL